MRFTVAAWLLSRALIVAVFIAASPHPLAAANNWDGAWYESIAEHGYGYAHIGAQSDIAFFPLFPLAVRALTATGLPWIVAAVAFNNLCFLGALLAMYRIARRRWNASEAKWCVAFTCACPMSLFASVAYPEAAFMLLSALAVAAYVDGAYLRAVLLAAAAGAASAIGLALSAAFTIAAAGAKRWRTAALAPLAFAGIAAFAAFCAIRFGNPLAFLNAQHAWRSGFGFDALAWSKLVRSLTSVEGFRVNIMTIVLVPVGAIAVWLQRRSLGPMMTAYALVAIALLLLSGEPISADRKAFTVVPILFALARPLARHRYAGSAAILASLVLTVASAWAFARFSWAG